jgi:hypothetical protein
LVGKLSVMICQHLFGGEEEEKSDMRRSLLRCA